MKDYKIKSIINDDDSNINKSFDLLSDDIISANIYNIIIKELVKLLQDNNEIAKKFNSFWKLTLNTYKNERMLRLCRVFDNDKNSLSIINLLKVLKYYSKQFSAEKFLLRIKDNPFKYSLAGYDRSIIIDEVDSEIKEIKSNPIVRKIILWRNNIIAHKSYMTSIKGSKELIKTISIDEFDNIIKYAIDLFNKYFSKYKATTWSDQFPDITDFLSVIRFLKIGNDKYLKDIEDKINKFS